MPKWLTIIACLVLIWGFLNVIFNPILKYALIWIVICGICVIYLALGTRIGRAIGRRNAYMDTVEELGYRDERGRESARKHKYTVKVEKGRGW